MIVTALITEYNPFHNGHLYHIQKAKEITKADYIIIIMSGNFVQRGDIAIIDKYSRAETALKNGADLVLELPVCYSTASAEFFALGAISIIDKLGIVDYVCFGSECGDITILKDIADVLSNEDEYFKTQLNYYLKKGDSFPLARQNALLSCLKNNKTDITDYKSTIEAPNNILGIEYIKALYKLNSNVTPVTIKREGNGYNNLDINNYDEFVSASAIRKFILDESGRSSVLSNTMPAVMYDKLINTTPISIDCLYMILYSVLQREDALSLTQYLDIDSSLSNKIYNNFEKTDTITELIEFLKTRDLTYSRIMRSIIHIILNIKKTDMESFLNNGITNYCKILGFKKSSSSLIRNIKEQEKIILINKITDAYNIISEIDRKMLNLDINATHLYNKLSKIFCNNVIDSEYKHSIIITN